jgi:hypothetical protein
MKRLTTITAFFFVVALFLSCDKKEDPKPVSKIVGVWNAVSSSTTMTINGMSYKDYLLSFGLFTEEEATDLANDLADALTLTGFDAEFEIKADGTWSGDSQFVSTVQTGKWTLSSDEKVLTLTNNAEPGQTETANVTKLTDTDLWFDVVLDKSQLPPGTPSSFEYTGTIKCTRKK